MGKKKTIDNDVINKIEFVESRKHSMKSANIYRVNERKLDGLVCSSTSLVKK